MQEQVPTQTLSRPGLAGRSTPPLPPLGAKQARICNGVLGRRSMLNPAAQDEPTSWAHAHSCDCCARCWLLAPAAVPAV